MARLRRCRLKVVVAAVDVHDRQRGELRIRNIVQTAHHNGDKLLAFQPIPARKGFDPAVTAEQMMDAVGAELIVTMKTNEPALGRQSSAGVAEKLYGSRFADFSLTRFAVERWPARHPAS